MKKQPEPEGDWLKAVAFGSYGLGLITGSILSSDWGSFSCAMLGFAFMLVGWLMR